MERTTHLNILPPHLLLFSFTPTSPRARPIPSLRPHINIPNTRPALPRCLTRLAECKHTRTERALAAVRVALDEVRGEEEDEKDSEEREAEGERLRALGQWGACVEAGLSMRMRMEVVMFWNGALEEAERARGCVREDESECAECCRGHGRCWSETLRA